jgi:DNA helicase-2/ATP-dependent DNA helicase PcrA
LRISSRYAGHPLEQNYRSTQHILDAANAVIRNNRGRKGKTLWTAKGEGEPVTAYRARDERDEAMYVADTVAAGCDRRGTLRDYAVSTV